MMATYGVKKIHGQFESTTMEAGESCQLNPFEHYIIITPTPPPTDKQFSLCGVGQTEKFFV